LTVGLDTSFFVKLLQGDQRARKVWERVARREIVAVISCISLFEIDKLGLKGVLARTSVDTLLEEVLFVCKVVWLDAPTRLRQAARIAHGNGLGMADALILTSLIEAKASEIYTADPDLAAYPGGPKTVRL
jgi:predicted nucleic acid-binding protein